MSGQNNQDLFTRLLLWLESELDAGHYKKLVTWPWAVFVALGGVGVITSFNDPTVAKFLLALAALLFIAYCALLILGVTIRSRQVKRELSAKISALSGDLAKVTERADKYATVLVASQNSDPDRFRIRSWEETMRVSAQGHTVIVRDLLLESGAKPLDVVSSTLQSDHPVANKEAIKFTASLLTDQNEVGMSIPSSHVWTDSHIPGEEPVMRVFLHYADHIAPRSVVRVRLRWEWPEYYRKLVEGQQERWYIRFKRPCDKLKYELILMQDSRITNTLKTNVMMNTPPLQRSVDSDNSLRVGFEVLNAPPNSEYGFRAEGAPVP